jgi:hypothetical protein
VTQPLVQQPTGNSTHAHVGGSAGGPGENGAACACGVSFDGFDTHADAIAVLNGHIAATKPPTGYRATAAELRRIADALDTLPERETLPFVTLSILPEQAKGSPDETRRVVDEVSMALLGKAATDDGIGGGMWHRLARGDRDGVHLTVQAQVPGPPDERDAEIERLKAELTKYRGKASCLHVLGDGARCDEPIVWSELGAWVHAGHDHDHSAAGPT